MFDYYPSLINCLETTIMKFWIDISHLSNEAIYSRLIDFIAYTSTVAIPKALIKDEYSHS